MKISNLVSAIFNVAFLILCIYYITEYFLFEDKRVALSFGYITLYYLPILILATIALHFVSKNNKILFFLLLNIAISTTLIIYFKKISNQMKLILVNKTNYTLYDISIFSNTKKLINIDSVLKDEQYVYICNCKNAPREDNTTLRYKLNGITKEKIILGLNEVYYNDSLVIELFE